MSEPPRPERAALFLDFDGTLVAIAATPERVEVPGSLGRLLDRLHERTGGALALITGRRIAEIDGLLGARHIAAAGLHGFERRNGSGGIETEPPSPEIEALRERLVKSGLFGEGVRLENKGGGLAIHYRSAPQREREVRETFHAALDGLETLHAVQGKMVIEARRAGFDKGIAIESFMREPPFAGRTPIFIGDDVTDEDGFRTVNALGGVSIKVGEGPSIARHRLKDVAAVHRWLERLAEDEPHAAAV